MRVSAGEQWMVDATSAGLRLDKFLAHGERLASRSRAAAALERGRVFLNDREASLDDAGHVLAAGDVVRVWRDRPGSAAAVHRPRRAGSLDIVYEDASLIVVNKPPGLLSVPLERQAGALSIVDQLEEYFRSHGKRKPLVVHRIDRDTSGLVLFAKQASAQAALKAQFRRREPHREYRAVVHGHPEPPAGTWRDYLMWDERALVQRAVSPNRPRAAEAISEYRVLETFATTSLLEVRLRTGKRNQIRVQASLRGHALAGERRYVTGEPPGRPLLRRQALHAFRLGFRHPVDGRPLWFEAALPDDFNDLLRRLRAAKR